MSAGMTVRFVTRAVATIALAAVAAACGPSVEPADMVLLNGKVVTVDDARPEAEAIAVRGDTIVAVGSSDEIQAYVGSNTEVLDLEGQLAIPGFIEGHGHFAGVGDARLQLNLMPTTSWDEIVAMVAEAVESAQPGELIRGRGWHQENWDPVPAPNVEGLPFHTELSRVSPDNPVILTHASGHATFANARAMEMAGITRETQNPPGGEIVRDAQGDPIGAFRETASQLLSGVRAASTPPDPRQQIALATEEVLSKGVTTFQDAGTGFAVLDILREMAANDELDVRLWMMIRASNEELAEKLDEYRMAGADRFLTIRGIKKSIDGALGSHGAWLLEPYSDLPTSTGLNTTPVEEIEETARLALEHGYQLCVHAIGDRGNRETLDLFQRTFEASPDRTDLRWRIEHAQHLHPDDIPRFAELNVIASMQGIHCTSDAPWVTPRLGEQRAREGAYVWRSLWDSGAVVTNGTDAPVEDVDPIESFYATVSRRLPDGSTFYPEERLTRMEALRSYTLNVAYAGFEEDIKGSISPGKLADIVVLSRDIMTVPEEEIPTAEVIYTIVGGDVKYRRTPLMTRVEE